MPQFTPMPTLVVGDVFTTTRWGYLRDNLNKLLNTGHRSLTVAQFGALTGLEGTAGVVAGDEVYLIVDATNGVLWHLVYESTETTYHWRFVGGPSLSVEVAASEATASTSFVDLATVLSITCPVLGEFDIEHGCGDFVQSGAVGNQARASVKFSAAAAVDGDSIVNGTANTDSSGWTFLPKKAITATTVVKQQYRVAGAVTGTFQSRRLKLTPRRVNHV